MSRNDKRNAKYADECRKLAEATYDLAAKAQHPVIIREFLNLAGKLVTWADRADRGELEPWASDEGRTD